jgi:hypothetical protein
MVISDMSEKISREKLTELIDSIGEHELRIDLDGEGDKVEEFIERVHLLRRALGLSVNRCEVFNTTHGYHIKLGLNTPLSRFEVILIQSMLGDDYKHTLAIYVQMRQNVPMKDWNLLFKEKFFLNRLGESFLASKETLNEDLSKKLSIFLTNQKSEEG